MRLLKTTSVLISIHLWLLATGALVAAERGMAVEAVLGKEAALPRSAYLPFALCPLYPLRSAQRSAGNSLLISAGS
jgi:hypothetical protein